MEWQASQGQASGGRPDGPQGKPGGVAVSPLFGHHAGVVNELSATLVFDIAPGVEPVTMKKERPPPTDCCWPGRAPGFPLGHVARVVLFAASADWAT